MQVRGDGTRETVMEWSVLDFDHRFSGRAGVRETGGGAGDACFDGTECRSAAGPVMPGPEGPDPTTRNAVQRRGASPPDPLTYSP